MITDAGANCCLCSSRAKYRCPSCDRQTCSLSCVTEHKLTFNCSGRRGISYVPMSEMTAETLTRDIALLDGAARVIESTSRAFLKRHMDASASASKRVKIGVLRKCCAERNIQLAVCPPMLARHLKNYTSVRKNSVYWTVEWHFAQVDVVLFERRVNERSTLAQAMKTALDKVACDRKNAELLREYFVLDHVEILVKDLDSHTKQPSYFHCDINESIRHNIANTKILEFPRFTVVLKTDLHVYSLTERRRLVIEQTQDALSKGKMGDIATENPEEHSHTETNAFSMPSKEDNAFSLDVGTHEVFQ